MKYDVLTRQFIPLNQNQRAMISYLIFVMETMVQLSDCGLVKVSQNETLADQNNISNLYTVVFHSYKNNKIHC